ncbi:YdhW family putative oxidoreductase system protein [Escherichia coli]
MANGWTGNILRVNLTTGNITLEDSSKFKSFVGGMGFGYKIMYDEVPPGTKPFDEANKLVFATGPLTGSGAPCSSRVNITSLSTFTKGNLVVDAHMGGFFAAQMKFAGYDVIIIEGKAKSPVWLKIKDDKVSLEKADFLWGKGTRATTEEICRLTSPETCVAAIGQAGENLVPLSGMLNSRNHSGGAGTGAIMGSKNLKAIAVEGTKGVNIADRQEMKRLNDYMMTELIGANNNHVVPSTPQSWAEYSDPKARAVFLSPPYSVAEEELSVLLESIKQNGDYADIACMTGSQDDYYYSTQAMSENYAAMSLQVVEQDICRAIAHAVRFECQTYPRPYKVAMLMQAPYYFQEAQIEAAIAAMDVAPEYADIRQVESSTAVLYLFSERFMTYGKAYGLCEWFEVEQFQNP